MLTDKHGGDVLTLLKDYWVVASGSVVVLIWLGRLTQQIRDLRASPQKVTVVSCRRQQNDCQELIKEKFDHGKEEFNEIKVEFFEVKKLIDEAKKTSEDRDNMILQHLLDLKK